MSSYSFAGLVRVTCDAGTTVHIAWHEGDVQHSENAADANGDGIVEFAIPNQDEVEFVTIGKMSDGRFIIYHIDLNAGGVTLASLEPFETPSFGAVALESDLVAIIDMAGFLDEGNPFTVGQTLIVTDGTIPETTTITFKDLTDVSYEFPDLVDPVFLDNLPNFTGDAEVKPFDSFESHPIPTVSEWGLVVMTLLLLAAGTVVWGWRRRANTAA
jgi:hypothetical protein